MDIQQLKDFINSYKKFHCKTEKLVQDLDQEILSSSIRICPVANHDDLYLLIFSGRDVNHSVSSGIITGMQILTDSICDDTIIIRCNNQKIKLVAVS